MTSKGGKGLAERRPSKSSGSESSAWERALRWLGRRDHSVRETTEYLHRQGFPAEVVSHVVERLCRQGYLDDGRFAFNRAEYWLRRGYGRLRAKADLEGRGIAEKHITEALNSVFESEAMVARELLQRRFSGVEQDERVRARAYRFLVARGFPEALLVVILGEPC
ncbi:Regulatory protein RecX [bacterium HR30]|nr:Regulatory protein RecX [bacterium HR30]